MNRFILFLFVGISAFISFYYTPVTAQMMGGGGMCGTRDRMPKSGVTLENLPDAQTNGAKIYAKFCSQCHALPSPKRHSADNWESLVERMNKRMQMMSGMGGGMMRMMRGGQIAAMSPMEKDTVLGYLRHNALKPLDGKNLASMDTPEYRSFNNVCSQCHTLPDPSLFKKSEWPEVVKRMMKNMEEAGVSPPSPSERKEVILFLESNSIE